MAAIRLFLLLSSPLCSLGFPHMALQGMPRAPPKPEGVELAPAQWFQQKLDHFNPSDTVTWKQRYFVNDTNWDRGYGPVFLMLNGEGEADPVWLAVNTDMMRKAEKFKALAILLEHRYYGQSHPTPDASTENLKYLSSRQALEDVVAFHDFFTTEYNLTSRNKWISFGGSYAGALSAWLRMKHPEVVVGAVASSAPVQVILDFSQYAEVSAQALETSESGTMCIDEISSAAMELNLMLKDPSQWAAVDELFNLDPPLSNPLDPQQFTMDIAGDFMGAAQGNKLNTKFMGLNSNISIDAVCAIMTDMSKGTPLQRYAAVSAFANNGRPLNASISDRMAFLQQTDWQYLPTFVGERQWYYQTCTEFGYYQTTNSANQPFGNLLPLEYWFYMCAQAYDIDPPSVVAAVIATNAYYHGREIPANVTNIAFPNGSLDPWHALSITSSLSNSLIAIFIEGTAHCANMLPPADSDPVSLVVAREDIAGLLLEWLSQ